MGYKKIGWSFLANPALWILWKFFLVPRIVKSSSHCPNSAIFVENVTILPGTVVPEIPKIYD
jgi:hypothetical protein